MNLITLPQAAELIGCGLTEKALQREARRGNLTTYRIARRIMTTEEAIREMVERCRVNPQEYASTSGKSAGTNQAASPMQQHGSFEKQGDRTLPQAAALASVQKLISGSRNTSAPDTSRNGKSVVYLKSR